MPRSTSPARRQATRPPVALGSIGGHHRPAAFDRQRAARMKAATARRIGEGRRLARADCGAAVTSPMRGRLAIRCAV